MQLEPNDLLLFARVVEEGSFSRAAQRLDVPISTVSRRITSLETQLKERLLLRTTRKLTVTELGLAMLEHARQVVEGVDAAVSLADHRQVQPSGRLRISMPPDLPFLAPVLAEFLSTYPSIRLEIDVSIRLVDLIAENFDVALRYGQLRDDATLAARRISEIQGSLYASPAYLKAHGTPKEPEALLQHRALHWFSRTGVPWVLVRGKARWEGVPPGRAVVNSPEVRIRMAVHGAGITLVEDSAAEPYVKAGQLTRVLPDWKRPPLTLWAVFLGRKLMPARTRAFVDALVSTFGSPGKS
jgi:DNA-binding transcriptional LysR family regulator